MKIRVEVKHCGSVLEINRIYSYSSNVSRIL